MLRLHNQFLNSRLINSSHCYNTTSYFCSDSDPKNKFPKNPDQEEYDSIKRGLNKKIPLNKDVSAGVQDVGSFVNPALESIRHKPSKRSEENMEVVSEDKGECKNESELSIEKYLKDKHKKNSHPKKPRSFFDFTDTLMKPLPHSKFLASVEGNVKPGLGVKRSEEKMEDESEDKEEYNHKGGVSSTEKNLKDKNKKTSDPNKPFFKETIPIAPQPAPLGSRLDSISHKTTEVERSEEKIEDESEHKEEYNKKGGVSSIDKNLKDKNKKTSDPRKPFFKATIPIAPHPTPCESSPLDSISHKTTEVKRSEDKEEYNHKGGVSSKEKNLKDKNQKTSDSKKPFFKETIPIAPQPAPLGSSLDSISHKTTGMKRSEDKEEYNHKGESNIEENSKDKDSKNRHQKNSDPKKAIAVLTAIEAENIKTKLKGIATIIEYLKDKDPKNVNQKNSDPKKLILPLIITGTVEIIEKFIALVANAVIMSKENTEDESDDKGSKFSVSKKLMVIPPNKDILIGEHKHPINSALEMKSSEENMEDVPKDKGEFNHKGESMVKGESKRK